METKPGLKQSTLQTTLASTQKPLLKKAVSKAVQTTGQMISLFRTPQLVRENDPNRPSENRENWERTSAYLRS